MCLREAYAWSQMNGIRTVNQWSSREGETLAGYLGLKIDGGRLQLLKDFDPRIANQKDCQLHFTYQWFSSKGSLHYYQVVQAQLSVLNVVLALSSKALKPLE
ncbi:hypothetical protein MIR68_008835 [Amoeboaphelidium protococcarum]|nr:hypothetical protein MIR68_008835 [Amoeboaphelidium protococcarum]